jgi:hypothetical protein
MVMAIVATGVIGISLDDGETGVRESLLYNVLALCYNSFGVVNHAQKGS